MPLRPSKRRKQRDRPSPIIVRTAWGGVMGEARRHTKGPWVIVRDIYGQGRTVRIADQKGRTVCRLTTEHIGGAYTDFNAALTAAAPELLEALAEVFADHGKVNSLAWTDKAAAALAKATPQRATTSGES